MNTPKSEFPYLIDISVTSKCPFACQFCYTSSVKEGEDADEYYLSRVIRNAAEAGTMNIVLGGGEPTLYDPIIRSLQTCKSHKIVTGVTTKNYKYHESPKFSKFIEQCDSLAISCNSIDELVKATDLYKAFDEGYWGRRKAYMQMILGMQDWSNTLDCLKYCKDNMFGVTLLGFKEYGFGVDFKHYEVPEDWVEQVKTLNLPRLGVDSILAKKYSEDFQANGVIQNRLVGTEGRQTCYIDAVKKVMKPSSFCDDSFPLEFKYNSKDLIKNTFAKF